MPRPRHNYMKATCKTKELSDQLNRLSRIPGTKGLTGNTLRITCDIAGLTLQRSTGECLASVTCEAEVETKTERPFDVGFEKLSNSLARMPGETAILSYTTNTLLVNSGGSSQKIPSNLTERTEIHVPEITYSQADGEELAQVLKCCLKAVGKDNSKPLTQGLHFTKNQDDFWCVGTDGKRVHAMRSALTCGNFHLSEAACHALSAILGSSKAVTIGITESVVSVVGPDFEIVLTQMADRMQFNQGIQNFMLPPDAQNMATLPCEMTKTGTRLAMENSGDKTVEIAPSKGCVFILGKNKDGEVGQTKIECKHAMEGPITVPGGPLIEAIESLGEEFAEITQTRNFINFQSTDKKRTFCICKMDK